MRNREADAAVHDALGEHRYVEGRNGPSYCVACDWESRRIGIAGSTQHQLHRAEVAVDAAAPFIKAEALREAAESFQGTVIGIGGRDPRTSGAAWLIARAEFIEGSAS